MMNHGLNMRSTPMMIILRVLHLTSTNSNVCLPLSLEFFIGYQMWFFIDFFWVSNSAYNMACASPASNFLITLDLYKFIHCFVASFQIAMEVLKIPSKLMWLLGVGGSLCNYDRGDLAVSCKLAEWNCKTTDFFGEISAV